MANNNINATLERIIALYDSGGDPNKMMQSMFGNNPNIGNFATQFNNMRQGRSNREFLLQLAKQNGVSEQNIQGLQRILGAK